LVRKILHLKFHGRIIDQLGFQTYQSATAAIAELVANAWDADAENVAISLPDSDDENPQIVIEDDGIGMTLNECEVRYLNVGFCRRGTDVEEFSPSGRHILGRKGIGKFAGFGIANVIRVETTSKSTGEETIFEMNRDDLVKDNYVVSGGELNADYQGPDDSKKRNHKTKIILKTLNLDRMVSKTRFPRSMARRFLLHQRSDNFKISVDGNPIPDDEDHSLIQFVFPRDYDDEQKPDNITIDGEWGEEELTNGEKVRWRVYFFTNTIGEKELQGLSVFSNGKLAQIPFFFNLTGGLGGQAGQSYMSGQIEADFVDRLEIDPMSAERQRINWEISETSPLLEWGQEKVKKLLIIWKEKRGVERRLELENRVAGFSARLERLPASEQKVVKKVLEKLGSISTLSQEDFNDLGKSILTSWEGGRLKEMMTAISSEEEISEENLLSIFTQAQVISSLNVGEAVKTNLLLLAELKQRLSSNQLENAVRDYIAKHPWMIDQRWETFQIESSINSVIKGIGRDVGFEEEVYRGRVDLVLQSGDHLLVIEFMRTGLKLDWDHLQRFRKYVRKIRTHVSGQTGGRFHRVTGLIVADEIDNSPDLLTEIQSYAHDEMYAKDWNTLLEDATSSYREYLEILVSRGEGDERLQSLLND